MKDMRKAIIMDWIIFVGSGLEWHQTSAYSCQVRRKRPPGQETESDEEDERQIVYMDLYRLDGASSYLLDFMSVNPNEVEEPTEEVSELFHENGGMKSGPLCVGRTGTTGRSGCGRERSQ